eukprot:scaffold54331_cov20-Tisochrysis_lutea.AAC.1
MACGWPAGSGGAAAVECGPSILLLLATRGRLGASHQHLHLHLVRDVLDALVLVIVARKLVGLGILGRGVVIRGIRLALRVHTNAPSALSALQALWVLRMRAGHGGTSKHLRGCFPPPLKR